MRLSYYIRSVTSCLREIFYLHNNNQSIRLRKLSLYISFYSFGSVIQFCILILLIIHSILINYNFNNHYSYEEYLLPVVI